MCIKKKHVLKKELATLFDCFFVNKMFLRYGEHIMKYSGM